MMEKTHFPNTSEVPTPSRGDAGFSLMELLIYMAILAVISIGMVEAFIVVNRGRGQVQARSTVNAALRFASDKVGQDLRSATSLSIPSTVASASSSLQMSVGGTSVSYCVTSGVLRRASGTACSVSSEAITSDSVRVSAPLFVKYANTNTVLNKTITTIEITVTAAYNSSSPDFQYTETKKTSVSLR